MLSFHGYRDHREPRDWRRPWRDPPGFFIPGCFCCGSSSPYKYITMGGIKAGSTVLQDTQGYDIDAWTAKTNMPSIARYFSCAEFVTDAAYVYLGLASVSPFYLTRCDKYTPDTWTTKTSNSIARYSGASFALNGKAYNAGGYNTSSLEAADVYQYDASGDSWATKASLPQTGSNQFGFASSDYGYSVAGSHSGTYQSTNYRYDDGADSWATKTSITTARASNCRGLFLDGLGYCAGGNNGGGILTTNEAYDEATNTWATKSGMSVGRAFSGAGDVTGSTGYVTAGQSSSSSYTQTHEEFTPNAWTTRSNVTTGRRNNFSAKA